MFAGHFLGFPQPPDFTLTITEVQLAQVRGQVLDQSYKGGFPNMRFYFNGNDSEYVDKSMTENYDVAVANQSDQQGRTDRGTGINAAISSGLMSAAMTMSMIKGALAVSSGASSAEMQQYAPSKKPMAGVSKQQFGTRDKNQGAKVFLDKLSKFVDPESLREGVAVVGLTSTMGAMRSTEMQAMQIDSMTPADKIALEAQQAPTLTAANQLAIDDAIRRIKFRRIMPPTISVQAGNPLTRISQQFREANGFKRTIMSGRFS